MKKFLISCVTALALSIALPSLALENGQTVDINTATTEQIVELKGIGAKKAEAIIAEREANGPFKDAQDLARVKGIGQATIDSLQDQLSFQ
ncbi:ComEA family DNA-binding protein [Phytohalomonas tamaricis]|uniref:ComEA family DNA-binding protein n=1 Tax=Phytohalomonas tamaricis TaxID=2081032 RepID=UPI0021D43C36|nr:ComEA family DNA-binding protein [Phytohalomonas tamaricis]